MSQSPPILPTKIICTGRAVGDFVLKAGTTAKGKPYQLVVGKMISGSTFVNVTESVPQGQIPYLPQNDDQVHAVVVPSYKDQGLLNLNVQLLRAPIVEPYK